MWQVRSPPSAPFIFHENDVVSSKVVCCRCCLTTQGRLELKYPSRNGRCKPMLISWLTPSREERGKPAS